MADEAPHGQTNQGEQAHSQANSQLAPNALGALLLSVVRPANESMLRRPVTWARDLARLGVVLPLPLVHDFGLLMAVPTQQTTLGARRALAPLLAPLPGSVDAHANYLRAIKQLQADETLEEIRALRPSDDLIVALLARVLGGRSNRSDPSRSGPPSNAGRTPEKPSRALDFLGPMDLVDLDRRLPELFLREPRNRDISALARFAESAQRIGVILDTLDIDTLKMLATYGGSALNAGGLSTGVLSNLAQVELLSALGSLSANDVVNFSLELLPSVLETARRPVAGSYATGGYQGLACKGSLDSLVLTELAWDDEELSRRLLDDEVLFHARERSDEESPRIHLILVDASASMRGERTTFARGVAIALAKRLELEGEEVRVRFFDRRLYEAFGAGSRLGGGASRGRALAMLLPHLLSFIGERGRSPERVLKQLLGELDVLRARDKRSPVVHLVTHAAFYAPRGLISEVRSKAALFAIFITPRGEEPSKEDPSAARGKAKPDDKRTATQPTSRIDLDFLDLLDGHWAVDMATIGRREDRAKKGREIVRASAEASTVRATRDSLPPGSIRPGPISQRSPER